MTASRHRRRLLTIAVLALAILGVASYLLVPPARSAEEVMAAAPATPAPPRDLPPAGSPDAPCANRAARAEATGLLRFLRGLPARSGQRVLSGQNIGHANLSLQQGYATYYDGLKAATGRLPALLGVCYAADVVEPAAIAAANRLLIAHWRAGGLVTVGFSPANPWTGGTYRDRSLGGASVADLLTPGTPANRRLMTILDTTADGLAELRDAGVVVLWRPYHEMNARLFWWSAGSADGWATPEEYVRLWRFTFEHFSVRRKLDNLLWVYAPNALGVEASPDLKPTTHFYPGTDLVDIVGLDYYSDTLADLNAGGGYAALLRLDKPFALTEVGPAFWGLRGGRGGFDTTLVIKRIRQDYPATTYFMFWQGWSAPLKDIRMGLVDNRKAAELLADPWVMNLGGVDWRREAAGR
jgi:mannan endo-1,4-beta-mannosidase